jgi:membrane protease YdiL (CAAX protease family)
VSSDPVLPPADRTPRAQLSRLRWVFVGREGLRAGWSVLIFVLLLRIGLFAIQKTHLISQPTNAAADISLSFGFVNEVLSAFAVLVATWIMAKIERRGRSYGFGVEHKGKLFLAGLSSGLFLITLLVFTLWKSGVLVIGPRLIFGVDVLRYGLLWFLAFCLVGLFEESLTRGFLLYTLTRGLAALYRSLFKTAHSTALGFWSAAVVMSVIFYLGHTSNPGESPVGLLAVFVGGMFFCYGVWRTGSIWWGIGMHAAWDWGQSFLFGVADSGIMVQHRLLAAHPEGKPLLSGGTTGPEGSILVVLVLAVGSLIVFLTLPRGHYYDPPPSATEAPQPATAAA